MKLVSKSFEELTTRELYELLRARSEVFVVEQKCAYRDIDGLDYQSMHMFYEENDKVIAYLRAFKADEVTVQMGRVLTIQRGTGLGGRLLKDGIIQIKEKFQPKKILIEAQCYATGFYEREGFKIISDEFLEDDIPHVMMELVL